SAQLLFDMADGRICDGTCFAQIKPDLRCASMPDRRDHSSTERRVSARLSTQGYALLAAWQPRLRGQRMVSRPEYSYIAIMRAVVRFSRRWRTGVKGNRPAARGNWMGWSAWV